MQKRPDSSVDTIFFCCGTLGCFAHLLSLSLISRPLSPSLPKKKKRRGGGLSGKRAASVRPSVGPSLGLRMGSFFRELLIKRTCIAILFDHNLLCYAISEWLVLLLLLLCVWWVDPTDATSLGSFQGKGEAFNRLSLSARQSRRITTPKLLSEVSGRT